MSAGRYAIAKITDVTFDGEEAEARNELDAWVLEAWGEELPVVRPTPLKSKPLQPACTWKAPALPSPCCAYKVAPCQTPRCAATPPAPLHHA